MHLVRWKDRPYLHARLMEALPLIAEKLPRPNELKAISIGNGAGNGPHALTSLVAQLLAVLDGFRGASGSAEPRS